MVSSPAVQHLARDLQDIFAARLRSLVVYGTASHHAAAGDQHGHAHEAPLTHTLAIVDGLAASDLKQCAGRAAGWHDAGLATPLLLGANEIERALDAFPFEFGGILSDHTVVVGADPFASLTVDTADLRRACEIQARGHLLHLREGYIETRGRSDALAVLIVRSAAPFAALVSHLSRLDGRPDGDGAAAARHIERTLKLPEPIASEIVKLTAVKEISSAEAEHLFPPYLAAVERLVDYVDTWGTA
jgi:hypothetical protein